MKKEWMPKEERAARSHTTEGKEQAEGQSAEPVANQARLASLHRHIGNQAVQRLLVARSGGEATELDDETAGRIEQARGGGQPLERSVQAQMGEAMGHDVSGVRAHTSPEADALNRQLGAKAFTTGEDVFFREGAYAPHSTEGQELIAHELTHVVQQGTGALPAGAKMTLNAPGDAYEQQANAAAHAVTQARVQREPEGEVQRQPIEEEEEMLQMQPLEEEEEMLQMQPLEEEEEMLQMQPIEEEEEEMQP